MSINLMLDIDDTLADTNRFCWQKCAESGLLKPEELSALKSQTGNYIYRANELDQRLQVWLSTQLVNPDFLLSIPPIRMAQESIAELVASGAIVKGYITSRFSSLHTHTLEWLASQGFPEAPVYDRPLELTDPYWKLKALATHADQHELIFIDNEIHIPDPLAFQGKIFQIDPENLSPYSHSPAVRFNSWPELVNALRTA